MNESNTVNAVNTRMMLMMSIQISESTAEYLREVFKREEVQNGEGAIPADAIEAIKNNMTASTVLVSSALITTCDATFTPTEEYPVRTPETESILQRLHHDELHHAMTEHLQPPADMMEQLLAGLMGGTEDPSDDESISMSDLADALLSEDAGNPQQA